MDILVRIFIGRLFFLKKYYMIRALIIYASLTGNTEEIAHILAERLELKGVVVEVKECSCRIRKSLPTWISVLLVTYTYGSDGELPDEIYDFYEG